MRMVLDGVVTFCETEGEFFLKLDSGDEIALSLGSEDVQQHIGRRVRAAVDVARLTVTQIKDIGGAES